MRFALSLFSLYLFAFAGGQEQVAGYPPGVTIRNYPSSADNTKQPTLFWKPEKVDAPVPLLVALHTWSGDYKQAGSEAVYARWCQQEKWAFVHPHFRGPNWTPDALGSDLVVADITSAIEFAKSETKIDPNRIYCIGVSGGGHASLLMAGRTPKIWAGVSAWCGISDIAEWHKQCSANPRFSKYAKHIEKALGGPPDSSAQRTASANHRSPITWLKAARNVHLDINHGIDDGRSGSVPFTHSLKAWNAIVPKENRFTNEAISRFYETRNSTKFSVPTSGHLYGKHAPLFRRTHQNTRLTIFQGGHQIVHEAALNWLSVQSRTKPAEWEMKNPKRLGTMTNESASGL